MTDPNAMPSELLEYAKPLTELEIERFKQAWLEQHAGDDVHRVHVLTGTVGNIMARNITCYSRFIVSRCCQAPVMQVHDWAPEVFRVLCSRCYREAGTPGREDIDMAQLVAP